jgi:hypothetical protein
MNWVLPLHIVVYDLSVTNMVTQTKPMNYIQHQNMSVANHKVSHSGRKRLLAHVFVQSNMVNSLVCDV